MAKMDMQKKITYVAPWADTLVLHCENAVLQASGNREDYGMFIDNEWGDLL